MAAPCFSLLFLSWIFGVTIGTESEKSSILGIQSNITSLKHKVLQLDDKMSSLENSIAAIPQMLQAENEQLLITVLDEMEIKFENYASTNKEMVEALRKELLSNLSRVEQSLKNQTLLTDELNKDFERFFDTSFILRAHSRFGSVSNVTCSSEVNYQKMEFSRDLDTGVSGPLPSGAKIFSQGKASVLDLSGVAKGERHGVYTCGYEKDGTRTGISFHLDKRGRFVRLVVASIGDIAELDSTVSDNPSIRWFHDGRHIPSGDGQGNLTITGVKVTDAGTYEQMSRYYSYFFKLVVRGCRSTLFGEGCDQECPPCYNGGTCHDLLGVCVCPTGFTGTNCELACGENKFGENCSQSCHGENCRRQVFCKPYPSGCSCAPGYWGYLCVSRCSGGKFGADCMQTCRCAEGPCNPYTGACAGDCSPGWTGQSCQIPA